MNDSIYIFIIISIIIGLIYFLYKIMLNSSRNNNDRNLQITSSEIMQQINILRKQKKYNIAESLAKNYLESKSGDLGVRGLLCKIIYDSGRVYEAIEQAKIVIKYKTANFDTHIFLSNCYVEVEKPMLAIDVLKSVLAVDENNVVAIKELAKIYYDTNQKISAVRLYKKLDEFIESNLEKVKNKIKIAEIHAGFLEFDLAIEEYLNILDIYPDDIRAKKRLIELYSATSDWDSLIELAEVMAAYTVDENSLWAMQTLMNVYQSLNNNEKALFFANLIKHHPLANQSQIEEDIAKIMFKEGKFDESVDLLQELILKEPNNIGIRKSLAKVYESKHEFETAIETYNEIIEIANPSDIKQINVELSNLYAHWALFLFAHEESEKCFKQFTTAIKYCSSNPEIYYYLGNVNKLIKNFNEAIIQYKRAIELDSANAEYFFALSECYEEINSPYEQKKALVESLKYNSENARTYYKLGLIDQLQNDEQGAIFNIQRAVELDSNFVDAKHKLALMFEHIGEKEKAIKLYQDIIKLDPENKEAQTNLKMLKD